MVAGAAAQSPSAPRDATAAQIAELEAQIALLTRQLEGLRLQRQPDLRWPSAQPLPLPPPSPLQRLFAVAQIEAGCPPGAVCLMVRCDSPHWR